jgi:hypothetical protein
VPGSTVRRTPDKKQKYRTRGIVDPGTRPG